MKKLAALLLTSALMAGYSAIPQPSPNDAEPAVTTPKAPVSVAVVAPEPTNEQAPAQAPVQEEPAPITEAPAPVLPAEPIPAKEPEIPQPAPQPEVKLPANPLKGMVRVAAPTADQVPAELQQWSPWAVADNAMVWLYGGSVSSGPYLAPGLAEKVSKPEAAQTTWRKHVASWDEGDRFYFQLEVTARNADGLYYRAGTDLIEVTSVPGAGPMVTGIAHNAKEKGPKANEITVWSTGYGVPAPRQEQLPAKVIGNLIPLKVVERFGPVRELGNGTYAIELFDGSRTEPIQAEMHGNTPYIAIDQLVLLMDGRKVVTGWQAQSFRVEWRADLGQLVLHVDESHPLS